MEELLELKQKLLLGDIAGALAVVEELEEMSKDDKINNIHIYAIILLKHLIKQQVKERSTKSWEVSINNSVCEIERRNKRWKSDGHYLTSEELYEVLDSAYNSAVNSASLEVKEGRYLPEELDELVDKSSVLKKAISLLQS